MEVKEILRNLREKNHLTQEQMAERINVTRQAVSRWETGMTQPNPELLKVLSREFGVSINTLLGSPQTLYCQCCGMPLTDDSMISHEHDGSFNEDYCKWCYGDGKFLMDCTMDEMIEHCAQFLDEVNKGLPKPITREEYIAQMKMYFPQLKRWRKA